MSSGIRTAASILAAGMVAAALIVLLAAHIASSRVSAALVEAGRAAHSSYSGGVFPTQLQVAVKAPRAPLKPEDRARLQNRFIDALAGQTVRDGWKVTSVKVTRFEAPIDSSTIQVQGTLICGPGVETINFQSVLTENRFGGFEGQVRDKDVLNGFICRVDIQ